MAAPTLPTPVAAPLPTVSKLSLILLILETALNALGKIPVIGGDAALAAALIQIVQAGMAAYQAEAGQPLDLSKIPQEQPVP